MIQATIPQCFWPFSMLMATYILNRLPTPLLINWKSPYELLYGKTPSYSSLKMFGCLCYGTNTRSHISKFEPRAHKCVYLGFSPGQKGYRLYNVDTKHDFVSRDMIFYEHVFPFSASYNENDISFSLSVTNDVYEERESNDLDDYEGINGTTEISSENDEVPAQSIYIYIKH